MRSSAEVLEDNRVKLTVEVDEADVAKAEDETLRRLTREVQMPGFRPGKVPRRLIQARLGQKGVREEVLRNALPDYFAEAVEEQQLDIISSPQIDIDEGEEGGPVRFSAIVEVRPEIVVPGYDGLVVTVPAPEATEEEIDAQILRLREQFASLNEVDRPVERGDVVTLDIEERRDGGTDEAMSVEDFSYEVGTEGITDGADEALVGAKAGDVLELDAPEMPGGPAQLRLVVKQVREKLLPDPDDAFASDASEFDTVDELREDLRTRMGAVKRLQTTLALRDRVADALVELVADEPPESLVADRREQLFEDFTYRLAQQRVRVEEYLEAVGKEADELVAELGQQAARDVKLDLALRAVAKAEDLEPDESDLDEEVVHLAGHANQTPAEMRAALEENGRMPLLRAEIRKSKALRWLLDHVAIVDEQGNAVDRESLRAELSEADGHHHDGDSEESDHEEH